MTAQIKTLYALVMFIILTFTLEGLMFGSEMSQLRKIEAQMTPEEIYTKEEKGFWDKLKFWETDTWKSFNNGMKIFWDLVSFNIPESTGMPSFIRYIFVIPVYAVILYTVISMLPFFGK
jgi:hypothetical protein